MTNTSTTPLRVAVIDDSRAVRERVAELVGAVPGVVVAGTGGDVWAGENLLETAAPDVLILDIELPAASGLELLKTAKRRLHAPIVIMLSTYDHAAFRTRCAELGADYYFNKLTGFDQAADVCRRLAARSS